ncbi:hypothetical protein EMCRGX_G003796 [Ephydatia muelleri]
MKQNARISNCEAGAHKGFAFRIWSKRCSLNRACSCSDEPDIYQINEPEALLLLLVCPCCSPPPQKLSITELTPPFKQAAPLCEV